MSSNNYSFRGNGLSAVLALVLIFVTLFFVTKGIIWLLTLVAPVLLILAALLDYKVIINYVKWVGRLFQRDVLWGIGVSILSVVGYPVLFAILFFRALFSWRVKAARKDAQRAREGEFAEYEELDQEPLPPLNRPRPQKETRSGSDYDQMFD
jgi:hypothetical protein